MKMYICGPVTGFSDLNLPTFEYAAEQLQTWGLETVLPHSFVPADASHDDAMKLCLNCLRKGDIDALVLLPGFSESTGSCLEIAEANRLGIPVYLIDSLLEFADFVGQRTDSELVSWGKPWSPNDLMKLYRPGNLNDDQPMNNGYMKNEGANA